MMASRISALVARSAGIAATLVLLGSVPAAAEVRMSGTREALRLEGGGAPLQEVLEALHRRYGISYRGVAGIERTVTATYTGSLRQVIAWLLNGQNFIVRSSHGDLDVVVLGSDQAVRVAGGRSTASPAAAPPRQPTAEAEPTPSGIWRDGDGNLIAPPARSSQFAPAKAAATWTDGDGNVIAAPGGQAAQ
jgi:hypothetical protein